MIKTWKFWQTYLCSLGYGVVGVFVVSFFTIPFFPVLSFSSLRSAKALELFALGLPLLGIVIIASFAAFGIAISLKVLKLPTFAYILFWTFLASLVLSFIFSYVTSKWVTQQFLLPFSILAGSSITLAIITTMGARIDWPYFLASIFAGALLSMVACLHFAPRMEFITWIFDAIGGYLWLASLVSTFIAIRFL